MPEVTFPTSVKNADFYLNNSLPYRESFSRVYIDGTYPIMQGTGLLMYVAVVLYAGDVVTKINVPIGGTAAVTPSNWWFALYSNAATPALLSQTADQLTAAIGANSFKSLNLAAAQTITSTGVYYIGINVTAATQPTLWGRANNSGTISGGFDANQKSLYGDSGTSGLTTTAPATIAAFNSRANTPYVFTS